MATRAEPMQSVEHSQVADLGHTLLGRVIEVTEGKLKVLIHDVGFVTASCLEHVARRDGGMASLVGERVLIARVDDGWRDAVVCGVVPSVGALVSVDDDEARAARPQTAVMDGRRVVLDASDEIVLQCGRGSITLTADGRIVIKGVDVVSRALRTNKIKGGTVNIN